MKSRVGILSLVMTALLPLLAAGEAALSVQRLGEGIWAAQPEQGANVGWFVLGDGVVVVDSGPDAATAKAILEKIQETAGKPVRTLVLTHDHGDHVGGAAIFAAAGAEVICHENAAGAVAHVLQSSSKARPGFFALSERLAFLGQPRRAAVYWLGTAHTKGDLIVLLPDDKILFTGDLVTSARLPDMHSSDVDPKGWEQILMRLAALDVDRIVPGHGAVGPRQGISDTLAYVHKVNELAKLFLDTRIPEELYTLKLRDPDNRIENVPVTEDHIDNVKAVIRWERARREKPSPTPAPTSAPTKAPVKKKS